MDHHLQQALLKVPATNTSRTQPLGTHHPGNKSSSHRWDQRDGWRQGAKEKAYKCTKEKQSLNRQRKGDRPSQKEGVASPRAQMSGKGSSFRMVEIPVPEDQGGMTSEWGPDGRQQGSI